MMGFGPPFGVPITDDIHQQYSPGLKVAWKTFDDWWKEQGRPARLADMPEDVKAAFDLVRETPIPGYPDDEGPLGAESCYMVGVCSQLEDWVWDDEKLFPDDELLP